LSLFGSLELILSFLFLASMPQEVHVFASFGLRQNSNGNFGFGWEKSVGKGRFAKNAYAMRRWLKHIFQPVVAVF